MVALILAGCAFYISEISSSAWCLWHQGSLDAVVYPISHNHIKPPRHTKQGFVAGVEAASAGRAGSLWQYASVSTITPHTSSPSAWHFTSRQPMRSGAKTSAGRVKKDLGRCWQSVVAMGVAVCGVAEECCRVVGE